MTTRDTLLPELDAEARVTRAFLERVPMDQADWKPHERSFALGHLANHIADMPGFGSMGLMTPGFDIGAPGGAPARPPAANGSAALLAKFDQNVAQFRAALSAASDDDLSAHWRMTRGEQVIMDKPRADMLRKDVLNHLIHHRGQLSVYLRLLGVPVPGAYGPTADER